MKTFKERVLKIIESIPHGRVVSYGQVAMMAGVPRGARMVGQILFKSGHLVPWWRVINNAGVITVKHDEHSKELQKTLLEKEDIVVNRSLTLDIERYRWRPGEKTLKHFELDDEYVQSFIEKYHF